MPLMLQISLYYSKSDLDRYIHRCGALIDSKLAMSETGSKAALICNGTQRFSSKHAPADHVLPIANVDNTP